MTNRTAYFLACALASVALCSACRGDSSKADTVAAGTTASVATDEKDVRAVVSRFGERLANVSLLAPDSSIATDLREQYSDLVMPELLAIWLEEPSKAPGRRVSSPWPVRIEVQSAEPVDRDLFEVTGQVVYMSSADSVTGGVEPVSVHIWVRRADAGSWRISSYSERTPNQ